MIDVCAVLWRQPTLSRVSCLSQTCIGAKAESYVQCYMYIIGQVRLIWRQEQVPKGRQHDEESDL